MPLDYLLRSQVGKFANWQLHDRSSESAMNVVLGEVDAQMPDDAFDVYWIDGGPPEMLCLAGASVNMVLYSKRYIELTYLTRRILGQELLDARKLAERTTLRIMAELAIRYGHADIAVLAFIRSTVGQGCGILDAPGASLLDLELQPQRECYAAVWFFGLLHELGHVRWKKRAKHSVDLAPLVLQALAIAIEQSPFTDSVKERLGRQQQAGILSVDQLCEEVHADWFAIFVLYRTTLTLMRASNENLRIEHFILEVYLQIQIVGLLDKCRRAAVLGDTPEYADVWALMLRDVSGAVRTILAQRQLSVLAATCIFETSRPSEEEIRRCTDLTISVTSSFEKKVSDLDYGLGRALRFMAFRDERPSGLLSSFAEALDHQSNHGLMFEADKFLRIAASFETTSTGLDALAQLVANYRHENGRERR